MIHGDACFAYFNKIWGIPRAEIAPILNSYGIVFPYAPSNKAELNHVQLQGTALNAFQTGAGGNPYNSLSGQALEQRWAQAAPLPQSTYQNIQVAQPPPMMLPAAYQSPASWQGIGEGRNTGAMVYDAPEPIFGAAHTDETGFRGAGQLQPTVGGITLAEPGAAEILQAGQGFDPGQEIFLNEPFATTGTYPQVG